MMRNRLRYLRKGDVVDGKYRVEAHLASGGMGDVYATEHVYTRRRAALKVMRPIGAATQGLFLREAEAAAKVRHPAVIEMFDAGQARDGTWYIVFELLEGADLEELFDEGELQPMELVRLTVQLLGALGATHMEGFVHRDVKPANIFVTRDATGAEVVKLIDFGVADEMGPEGAPALGHRVGTLEYMSPEQAHGRCSDRRSDLWSVGAVLFRGLTGRAPVDTKNPREAYRQLGGTSLPSVATVRPDLPTDLVDVVDRALALEPDKRWSTAADMAQALMLLEPTELAALASPGPKAVGAIPLYRGRTLERPAPASIRRAG